MINVEAEIFAYVSKALHEKYSNIYITGEYVKKPPQFPCVYLLEADNQAYFSTRTTESNENHVQVVYEADVFSNKKSARKSECREILALIDEKMMELGFTRTLLTPVPNYEDATIYRLAARYRAVISKDKVIYRR